MTSPTESSSPTGLNVPYMGVSSPNPGNNWYRRRDPTTRDFSNYQVLDRWCNLSSNAIWMLASKAGGVATWMDLASSGSGVTSVTGTVNSITATPTTGAVVVSISATYPGQTSITTLGTITTGTWNGSVVAGQYGGTGVANTGLTITLSGGASGRVLTSDSSGNATWQVASGGGITTINGNIGSVTGSTVTIASVASSGTMRTNGSGTNMYIFPGDSNFNVGWGISCMTNAPYTNAQANTAFGRLALSAMTDVASSTLNCAFGNGAMASFLTDTGGANCAFGVNALGAYTGGSVGENVALGGYALNNLLTGGGNVICAGGESGTSYTGAESYNIIIGYDIPGTTSESNVLRVGKATGSSAGDLAAAYVQGIAGVTVASSAAVLINTSNGQLGTVPSAARYKENIEDMEDESEIIYKLRPVRYDLRAHPEFGKQTGLVADEVQKVAPRLVSINQKGEPESVAYHELPAMLLNEIQKLRKEVDALKSAI